MVHSNLHIIVPHTVNQKTFQMEQVIGGSQLQQARELDASVALRYLTDQAH